MGRGRCLPELEDEKSFYRARWVPFLDGQDQVRFRQLVAAMPGVALAFTKMWSLMEFLNPGWLGSREGYRRRFLLPIQQQQEKRTMEQLKLLTGPFILRRTKTDKAIIADLPEKFETKVFCYLTREQASLYKAVTDEMLELIDQADPMSRRGLVLATLTKLKQICNHPPCFGTVPGSGTLGQAYPFYRDPGNVGQRPTGFGLHPVRPDGSHVEHIWKMSSIKRSSSCTVKCPKASGML